MKRRKKHKPSILQEKGSPCYLCMKMKPWYEQKPAVHEHHIFGGIPAASECYYLCVARGQKMLFVSDVCFAVNDWTGNDPRIHKQANCRYRDKRDWLDIVYLLIKNNMLRSTME